MKKGWETKQLSEVCKIVMGTSPPGETYNSEGNGMPLINGPVEFGPGPFGKTVKSKFTTAPNKLCKENDLILCVRGSTTGKTNIAGFEACIGRGVAALRAHDLQPWINYFIYAKAQDIFDLGTGSTFPNISAPVLAALPILVPPLAEQRRIVGVLDEAFEGIATAKANAEKNLQNAKNLFNGALESIADIENKRWHTVKLGDVCGITSQLVDPRIGSHIDLKHVGAGNVESETGRLSDVKTAREEGLISGKFLFEPSMILYSKIRPYLKKVVRPDFRGLCSADMYPLMPDPDLILRDFLYYSLLTNRFTDYAILGSARAGMPKVNREHLFAYELTLPSLAEQRRLCSTLDGLFTETQGLRRLIELKSFALDELKRSLLHEAFSGKL